MLILTTLWSQYYFYRWEIWSTWDTKKLRNFLKVTSDWAVERSKVGCEFRGGLLCRDLHNHYLNLTHQVIIQLIQLPTIATLIHGQMKQNDEISEILYLSMFFCWAQYLLTDLFPQPWATTIFSQPFPLTTLAVSCNTDLINTFQVTRAS